MTNQKNNSEYRANDYTDKSTEKSRIIRSVRKLFLEGGKYRAIDVNLLCNTNDARKIISDLRNKEGWKIEDCRLPNGCKLYWLDPDKLQQELFEQAKTIGQVADESKNNPESLMYQISRKEATSER